MIAVLLFLFIVNYSFYRAVNLVQDMRLTITLMINAMNLRLILYTYN
ncbi:hypothetical protein YPPY94_2028 [Yersinia pestis PY-94]|nr:hypothetical protein YPPY16_2042 [Yersinia pestis PY-16]EIR61923.1 hypothetical protein YPPY19_2096 [Yersinia pestis PY-19]EIS19831.1 hypothetical protein YPPY53_2067 [Yersinia pestis PY-53]EIS58218.1 hypothetical protein YPPY63_2071 [Yersinia pestis PY-63]EIS96852.1 hypothetical protein YPPY89_2210 [Yersinia pestis PY-89]EIT15837.1 hypothetical protein YPPY93_2034 [Yersinia pestis PY-93]EIT17848.1 hypothetical protein YPPY94_2028 [Yersinia pestis PY-94]EIT46976.1 hypothetical protein YPP